MIGYHPGHPFSEDGGQLTIPSIFGNYNCRQAGVLIVADQLLRHLQATYPLTNTHHINIYFENRPNVKHHAMGFASPGDYKGKLYTTIHVGLGFKKTPRPLLEVLDTLAHEYKHAMQFNQAPIGDDTNIAKYGDCVEADIFAKKIVPEFISKYNLQSAA